MSVVEVPAGFDPVAESKDKVVFLLFSATWCGPCKAMAPILADAAEAAGITVHKVDADERRDLVDRFHVRGVPNLLAVQDGDVVGRLIGKATADLLNEFFLSCENRLR